MPFGSIFKGLFGSEQEQSTSSTTVRQLSPEQRELYNLGLPHLRDTLQNVPNLFPAGTEIPGLNAQEQRGRSLLRNAALGLPPPSGTGAPSGAGGGFGPLPPSGPALGAPAGTIPQAAAYIPQAADLNAAGARTGAEGITPFRAAVNPLQQANEAANFFLFDALRPESNPYLRSHAEAAIRPLVENFGRNILPGIASGAVETNTLGGSRQGIAEGLAAQGLTRDIGDTTANIYSSAYDSGLEAALGAFGVLPQISQAGTNLGRAYTELGDLFGRLGSERAQLAPLGAQLALLPGQVEAALGAQSREIEQAQRQEQVQRNISQSLLPYNLGQEILALAFGAPLGTTTTEGTSTQEYTPSPFEAIAGIASLGAGLGAFGPVAQGAAAAGAFRR